MEALKWIKENCNQEDGQKQLEFLRAVRDLELSFKSISEEAEQYTGCNCDQDDCGPGDCWGCRMMRICDLSNMGDDHE